MSERQPTTPVPTVTSAATVTAEPATRRARVWPRRVPARIGRARTSTVVLAVLFVALFFAWDPSAMSTSLSDPAPASTEQPAPTTDAPAPTTTTTEPTPTTSGGTTSAPPSTSSTTTAPSTTTEDDESPTSTPAPTTTAPAPTTTAPQTTTPRTTDDPPTSAAPTS
ncbi:hypothetical protein [Klenkia terrae]|uniref:Uncharacterized protein n=1 Tax=Klenkia terrae TaxID=1052259 RepID=A0ABU8EDR2_9ACTN|nr:hypothetical protein [Klenkia terrae]